ncbi:MAG: hypothetical protein ACYS8I_14280 [Planctomycetota bacterium]|jgi:hypothetical protein
MGRPGYKVDLKPAFLICAAVLAAAGGGMSVAIRHFNVYLQKMPLSLKKSLDALDESDLGPYGVLSKTEIANADIIKELGTEDYVQLVLEDEDASSESPVGKCMLFVTYYDIPDRVPHVPEECYAGVGYQKLSSDNVSFKIDDGGRVWNLSGRYVVFSSPESARWGMETEFPIFYVFRVNGEYSSSREQTRLILNKGLLHKYSYFSKVEWKFFNTILGQTVYPDKEEAVAASERLLAIILPILEREHWPEWPVTNDE